MPRFKNTDPSGVPVALSDGRVLAPGEHAAIQHPSTDDQRHIDAGRLSRLPDKPSTKRSTKEND